MKIHSVQKLLTAVVMLLITGAAFPARAQLTFSNTLIDFDSIICVARDVRPTEQHLCDQFFGCFAVPGGSIYIVSGFKNNQRKVTDLLANATVQSGRYAGRKLSGGAFISPDLSYDGKIVLFGWKPSPSVNTHTWTQDQCFHIFKINLDGTGLVQLTDGKVNDFDPCWLPSGRIVFISERRGGYGRCHLRPVPTYTLYSMKDDGSDIIPLSYHETNEWNPSVDNSGMILYSRWDYVDRDDCIAHHPWICYPDGRDPRSWHGNYPVPTTTMEGSNWPDGRNLRPWAEVNVRAIPNSTKYVATGTGHHTQSFGDLIIVDRGIRDDGMMSQITGITTNKTTWKDEAGPWATAWPLSEDYYLASYNGDIVFLDKSANHIMLCPKSATPAANLPGFKLIDPIPVKKLKVPPNLAVQTFEGEREKIPHEPARLSVMNVYESDLPFPNGTKIKWFRVIQLIPKTTININDPQVCAASEAVARMPLGIVPVESDGSAYFEAPVDRCLMFQVLDSNFMAVQSMRSLTYVHKGEHLTCLGCHEDKWKATQATNPIAMSRAPSKLQPEFIEALPVNYYRTVKPIFDNKCVSCHSQERKGPDMGYESLKPYMFYFCDGGWPYTNGNINQPEIGGSRTIPGKFGARRSDLYKHLNSSHHDVDLTRDEVHRITLWLDCNSNRLGSEVDENGQKAGRLVWPSIDVDPENPLGLEDPTVAGEPTNVTISPAAAMVKPTSTVQLTAIAVNQTGQKVTTQPAFLWSVSGGGTITQSGLFTAGSSEGGPFTISATATIGGSEQKYTAAVTVTSVSGDPLPAGNIAKLLCFANSSSSTCIPVADTSSVESEFVGKDKATPVPGDQQTVNGATYTWSEQTSQSGTWFSGCGDNVSSYSSITLVNSSARSFKIAYLHDDHFTVWMNGEQILTNKVYSTQEQFSPAIDMPSGHVPFIIKHTNTGGNGSLEMRFVDASQKDISDLSYYFEPPTPVHVVESGIKANIIGFTPFTIKATGKNLKINGNGKKLHHIEIFNTRGQRITDIKGTGNLHYALPMKSNTSGMLVVRLEIDGKKYGQTIAVLGNQ